ncbi:alpha/beta hydrolase [Marihabitans asiaticum]|uniref:Pimeloyl-ACP methyl ester carboxylesterase n=1 Tax=Marihabitans asiaticum TaxID=415218 RepID=A0A560WH89_9MICO|nr:alpha/beta hydrolase [Marihabitans asiaticum]TWD17051.1 pimeloyl-ACP methyl ester carboxylesterase [Marihabitans asiaticum]
MSDAAAQPDQQQEVGRQGMGLAEPWGGVSRTVDLDGNVHYVEWEGPKGAPAVVLVHGLGGSHLNWVLLGERLSRRYRVLAPDLVGFGLTRAVDERSASVRHNAKLVRRFLDEVVGDDVILVGNSMGGLISSMVASRSGDGIRGVVLIAPALAAPKSRPGDAAKSLLTLVSSPVRRSVRQRLGRSVTVAGEVEFTLRLCVARWELMDRDVLEAHVDLAHAQLSFREKPRAFREAGQTMISALARHSVTAARLAGIDVPVLLIQGTHDRLVPVSAARWAARLNEDWTYLEMPGVGHVPMIEVPDETMDAITDWAAVELEDQSG